jgi:hypothetical protein
MVNNLSVRICTDIVLTICLIQGWWLVLFLAAIIHVSLFSYPFEIIIAGIVYDSLFGLLPGTGVRGYAGTIAMVVVFLIVYGIKKLVRR